MTKKMTDSAAPITFTVVSKAGGPMTKRIGLDKNGNIVKDASACALARGEARRIEVPALDALPSVIHSLTVNQALVCGVAANGQQSNLVLSRAKSATTEAEHITRTRGAFEWPDPTKARTLFPQDHDPHPRCPVEIATPEAFISQLARVDPQWHKAGIVRTFSTSSAIYKGNKLIVPPKGFHLYAAGNSGSPDEYSEALFMECWRAGLGYIAISRAGSMLARSIFDASVHQPERLMFEAGAVLAPGSGLTQRLPPPEHRAGDTLDFSTLKPTVRLRAEYKKLLAKARRETAPDAERVRERYIEEEAQTLVERSPRALKIDDARRIVATRSGGNLYADDMVHLDEHGWVSVFDILREGTKYIGATGADPAEPKYHAGPDGIGHNVAIVQQGAIFSQAHGGIRYELHRDLVPRPKIILVGNIDQQFAMLDTHLSQPGAGIYQRSESVVEPILASKVNGESTARRDPNARVLYEFNVPRLILAATEKINFEKRGEEGPYECDCPEYLASTYLAAPGRWSLPPVKGIAHAPFMRPDGSIHATEGYDADTGMILVLDGLALPDVPRRPGKEDVARAKKILAEPFRQFPFADKPSSSVPLSFALTIAQRAVIAAAVAHLFDATAAGSGKSLLVDVCALAVTGVQPSVMALVDDPIENEKRIASALMEGDMVIKLDNLSVPIGGDLLNMVLTEPLAKLRVLGSHTRRAIENRQNITATGNVLTVLDDMRRRTVMCTLDAKMEKPELRTGFRIENLRVWARANRARFVWALLVLQRAHFAAGRPRAKPALGSFEDWCANVRDVLIFHGYPDPVETQGRIEGRDTSMRERATIFESVHRYFGRRAVLAKQITDCLERGHVVAGCDSEAALANMRAAFDEQFGKGGHNPKVIGEWLHKNLHRVAGGYRLEREEDAHRKLTKWRVVRVG